MTQINIEIKARNSNHERIREILKSRGAHYKGIDHQIDIYFKTNDGRLKLRKGDIENYLIYYEREDKKGPKQSDVILFESESKSSLEEILIKVLGILVKVDKKREIYFISNIKFHLDNVRDLGSFMEIEAIDEYGKIGKEKLLEQCQFYLNLFEINEDNLVKESYSDLIIKKIVDNI